MARRGLEDIAAVERVESRKLPPGEESFLVLEKARFRTLYKDGSRSRIYPVDCVHRRGVDSVAIVLYDDRDDRLWVGIRKALRATLDLRARMKTDLPLREDPGGGAPIVWEAVAGSLEPEDRGEEGVRRRVVEETWEEAGFRIDPCQVEELGAGFLPSHGQSTEKIHMRCVRVRRERRLGPGLGEGPAELGRTEFFEATEVLRMCRAGEIQDPKVEIGVTRLVLRLSGAGGEPVDLPGSDG